MSCSKTYDNVLPHHVALIQDKMGQSGATVTALGPNQYRIDTHQHDIVITATYDEAAKTVTVKTGEPWYVSCDQIWGVINPMMDAVRAIPAPETVASTVADAKKSGAAGLGIKINPQIAAAMMNNLKAMNIQLALKVAGDAGAASAAQTSAAGAVKTENKTALYVAGGALALGALWYVMKN